MKKTQLPIKKWLVLMLPIMLNLTKANAQCTTSANVYTFNFLSKKYELIKETKTWSEAAQCAVDRGGHLVQIDSLPEQVAIYAAIIASGVSPTYHPVEDGGGTSYIWIGATDKNIEGTWIWDGDNNNTGTNFWNGQGANGTNNGNTVAGKYVNWGGKSTGTIEEPDNYDDNQDAAAIGLTGWPSGSTSLGIPGEWNDIAITNTLYFIVEYDDAVNIKEIKSKNIVNIYPNPSAENITIALTKPLANGELRLFNVTGQLIFEKNNLSGNNFNADISALSNGIYFIQLNDNGIIYRSKFAKK